jgi:hypothetical protein
MQFGGVAKLNANDSVWVLYNIKNSGLPDNNTISVLVDNNNNKWIGTLGGGMAKFNDTTWTVFNSINSPIPGSSVPAIILDKFENLWIGTSGGLVIYNPNGIVNIKNKSSQTPKNYTLYQNYPNPFNPVTKIKYSIPISYYTVLKIFDVMGKEVVNLVSEKQLVGVYSVNWDASNYPS